MWRIVESSRQIPGFAGSAILVYLLASRCEAALISIDFDNLSAMPNTLGPVPPANQLSNQLVATTGAKFSSGSNFVAVVVHGFATPSQPNIIGGTTAAGNLDYSIPIDIQFFDPANGTTPAVTSFVEILGDWFPVGGTATMQAFDVQGQLITFVTQNDLPVGPTLTINAPGIHSVRISQNGTAGFGANATIGFDNLRFESVQVIPEPGSVIMWSLASIGLLVYGRSRLRARVVRMSRAPLAA
jgi:hypothetical protein